MKTIIVATDFSDIANNAVNYAAHFARDLKHKLVLFHLHKLSTHEANALINTVDINQMVSKKRATYEKYATDLSAEFSIQVAMEICTGDFLDELKMIVDKYSGDMLVLGMPPKSFEQDLLGNTTTEAIYKFKFPILSVPATAQYKGIKRILFACDLNKEIQDTVLVQVQEYALALNAEVEVFYVGDAVKKVKERARVEKSLVDIIYHYKNEPSSDSVIEAILKEANIFKADVLIMIPYKYGFWESVVHISKTRAVASNGVIPLLSIFN